MKVKFVGVKKKKENGDWPKGKETDNQSGKEAAAVLSELGR